MQWIPSTSIVLITIMGNIFIINQWDAKLSLSKQEALLLPGVSALMGWTVQQTMGHGKGDGFCLSVVLGCLLVACITDLRYYMVHNFIWWMSGTAAVAMALREGVLSYKEESFFENMISVILFLILQLCFFSKLYGRADCYAFCVCGLAFLGLNMHIYHCLMHMLVAYFILFVIQLLRKNIGKSGNLKVPIAFLPYITASFLIILHKYAKLGVAF